MNGTHFDAFLNHFREALKEAGVPADKANEVLQLLESRRSEVLNG